MGIRDFSFLLHCRLLRSSTKFCQFCQDEFYIKATTFETIDLLFILDEKKKLLGIWAYSLVHEWNRRRINVKNDGPTVYVSLENLYIKEKYVENAKHKHLS